MNLSIAILSYILSYLYAAWNSNVFETKKNSKKAAYAVSW